MILPAIILKKIKSYLISKDLLIISSVDKSNIFDIERDKILSAISFQKLMNKYYTDYSVNDIKKELNYEIHYYKVQGEFYIEVSNYLLSKYNIHCFIPINSYFKKHPTYYADKIYHSNIFGDINNYETQLLTNVKMSFIYRCKKVSRLYHSIMKSHTVKSLIY
jgi:hypothetical protein